MTRTTSHLTLAALAAAALFALSPALSTAAESAQDDGCLAATSTAYGFQHSVAIPDGAPQGVLIGPIAVPGSGPLGDVAVVVDIQHPAAGDVSLKLCYDANNDGRPEASVPLEFYLAREQACASGEPFAYPISLNGRYYFRDGNPGPSDPMFASLDQLPRGGAFYLAAADTLAQKSGKVFAFSVYVANSQGMSASLEKELHGQVIR